MITHEEASELLGAYALDAVDGEECTAVEEHLNTCPRCRAELDSMREVAAAMGNSVDQLPDGLWSHIASRLPEREGGEDVEPPPLRSLADEGTPPPLGVLPATSQSRARTRRNRYAVVTLSAVAVAAAAVALVLGINLTRANDHISKLQAMARETSPLGVALRTPGHQVVNLDTVSNQRVARFVVVPDGRGYLISSKLPALDDGRTYQLWGIVGGQPISLGLLGSSPQRANFTMAGTTKPSSLAITTEPAGGTVEPTGSIVASGTV